MDRERGRLIAKMYKSPLRLSAGKDYKKMSYRRCNEWKYGNRGCAKRN